MLKAIAGLGGGSQRHIGGEMSPQRVALELLREVTEPGLARPEGRVQRRAGRGRVSASSCRICRPGRSRFWWGGICRRRRSSAGELIVTGQPRRRDGAVRDAGRVSGLERIPPAPSPSRGGLGRGAQRVQVATALAGATASPNPSPSRGGERRRRTGAGNSFIPRLWARHAPRSPARPRAPARRFRMRSSRSRRSSTSSRPTRRCWCWRPTPTASGSA